MTQAHDELVTVAGRVLLWQACHAEDRIWLASPYLSAPAADQLVKETATAVQDRRLLTTLDENAVRRGALSAVGLLKLRSGGFEIANVENLHAKLSLVDSWGLVGSANLTVSGLGLDHGNLELGIELGTSQHHGAEAIFKRWWKRASPVSVAELERLAALPVKRPPGGGKAPGPRLSPSGAEDLEAILAEDPATAKSRGYWIKAAYQGRGREDWWNRGWISDWRPASYSPRDLIVVYLSAHDGGPARCPAVVRAMTRVRHDPEFVLAAGDAEAIPQWPYVTETVRVAQLLPVTEGVELETMGKTSRSLQNGYCKLTRGQFESGIEEFLKRLN
jgi:hypothetical protein